MWDENQVGRSDPVFMKLFQQYALSKIPGLPEQMFAPIHEKPAFPYESQKIDKAFIDGDSSVKFQVLFGQAWLGEANSGEHHFKSSVSSVITDSSPLGKFRTWDDLKFLKDNWKGKILLKGIQNVEDAEKAVEAGVDGIIVSNHGQLISLLVVLPCFYLGLSIRWSPSRRRHTIPVRS